MEIGRIRRSTLVGQERFLNAGQVELQRVMIKVSYGTLARQSTRGSPLFTIRMALRVQDG